MCQKIEKKVKRKKRFQNHFFREEHDRLVVEEAQVRYELDQLQKDLSDKLAERDQAHSERIKLMEQVFFPFLLFLS